MRDLTKLPEEIVKRIKKKRTRDRKAFWASGTRKCKRELFWEYTNEPETNPTDFRGILKMGLGSLTEDFVAKEILGPASLMGLHTLQRQVAVGGSTPVSWDGYVDFYLVDEVEPQKYEPFILELKTIWGVGADILFDNPQRIDKHGYFEQLGLYLKDFHDKHKHVPGCLYFICISSDNAVFGTCIQYHCEYLPERNSLVVTKCTVSDGRSFEMDLEYPLDRVFEHWKQAQAYIDSNQCPEKGDYQYKYELTPSFLASLTDNKIKKAVEEGVILGDWEPKYSSYKNKILETDKINPTYTAEEIEILISEYERRHPKSTLRKKILGGN